MGRKSSTFCVQGIDIDPTILDNASILDALAEDIDDECHSESIGSGQKIDL